MNTVRLIIGGLVSASLLALSAPTLVGAAPAVQNPAPYLLARADMPAGWSQHSLSGTGVPGLLSKVCTGEDRLAGTCADSGVRFNASSGVPFVVEGLINWATPSQAIQVWGQMIKVAGSARTMLGRFGTASRTFEYKARGADVYLTAIAKGHVDAIVEYADTTGPTVRPDAAYWDTVANALIPPKSKPPTTTTTTTTFGTTTTSTTVPITTTVPTTTATTQPVGPPAWSEVLPSDAYSVFCTSATSCTVVGESGDISTYTGSGWRAYEPPTQPWAPSSQLQVSCPTPQFCMAMDDWANTYAFNGSGWSQVGSGGEQGGGVSAGISCVSSQFCLMVDDYGDDAVYTGSGWEQGHGIPGLSPDGTYMDTDYVPDVDCVSTSFCAVVSDSGVAYVYDGAWNTDVIDPDTGGSTGYAGLSCPVPGSCMAMEDNGDVVTYSNGSWGQPAHIDGDSSISAAFVSCRVRQLLRGG